MKAYCWASGLIEFGGITPPGAIQIASGREADLRKTLDMLARHGKGASAGKLLVPGVPEAETEAAASDALAKWLEWCASTKPRGVKFASRREER